VISLPIASAQSRQLMYWSFAGDGTAYPITRLNPYIGQSFRLSSGRAPLAAHSHHTQIAPHAPLPTICATVGAAKSP
jgi:hypothetical protein